MKEQEIRDEIDSARKKVMEDTSLRIEDEVVMVISTLLVRARIDEQENYFCKFCSDRVIRIDELKKEIEDA